MIDKDMQARIDAPLADPVKIHLPEGKRRAPRSRRLEDISDDTDGGLRISRKEVAERKDRALGEKLNKLLDYYATTDLEATKVAEHLGLYRQVQTGKTDDGKPIFSKVLDVQRVATQLAWRRKAAA